MAACIHTRDYAYVRECLLNQQEIAFLDVREEAPHAQGHPLFAANFPLSQIELLVYDKLPRRDVPIVTFDAGEGLAEAAAERLISLGYSDVSVFSGGLNAWRAAGGELFIDVNVPSKAFGEMVEATCGTPTMPPEEVEALRQKNTDMVIVDVRRFDEYNTMCVPDGINVPGAELLLRVPELVSSPDTQIIVNCAGRTRGLIGTQSLINAGLPNPISALRNGTIGWVLADQSLQFKQSRCYGAVSEATLALAMQRSRKVADQAGVQRLKPKQFETLRADDTRTLYCFDVRDTDEYQQAHLPGFLSVPGGQMVQETEMQAPVRGARIVLTDDNGVRANMTASWLAQMAWEVYVLDGLKAQDFSASGKQPVKLPANPGNNQLSPDELQAKLSENKTIVIDVSLYAAFKQGHIAGAWYLLRSQLADSVKNLPFGQHYVVTSDDGSLAQFVVPELQKLIDLPVWVLSGGNQAWISRGYKLEAGDGLRASRPIDRYERPYEGTAVSKAAMQAYLDWEFGLIDQLQRDGSHHFKPMRII